MTAPNVTSFPTAPAKPPRRRWPWLAVAAAGIFCVAGIGWASAQTGDLDDAKDDRRAARSALEASRTAENASDSRLVGTESRRVEQAELARQILDMLEREVDIATRDNELSRQSVTALLNDDAGRYNDLRDQSGVLADEFNALVAQTDVLISEFTGEPAPIRREPFEFLLP